MQTLCCAIFRKVKRFRADDHHFRNLAQQHAGGSHNHPSRNHPNPSIANGCGSSRLPAPPHALTPRFEVEAAGVTESRARLVPPSPSHTPAPKNASIGSASPRRRALLTHDKKHAGISVAT